MNEPPLCTCTAEELSSYLKVVPLAAGKLDAAKFRERCHSKKGRAELLKDYNFCIHCACGVCHPQPLLGFSHEHRVILLRLSPVLNTALNSLYLNSAEKRKQVLAVLRKRLEEFEQKYFFNGILEDYVFYTHFEGINHSQPVGELTNGTVPLILPSTTDEPEEKLFSGTAEANPYQCLILRVVLEQILNLRPLPRQVAIARLKLAQAKEQHLRVTPVLEQIAQRAYFDNPTEAQTKYELIRNYGKNPQEEMFRPPVQGGDVPELQILLGIEQPAQYYKLANATIYEQLPQALLLLTFFYEALRRSQLNLSLGEVLEKYASSLEPLFWNWAIPERRQYLTAIQKILTNFNDQYLRSPKTINQTATVKEERFKVSEDLLDLADSTELHTLLKKATLSFFGSTGPGQKMVKGF